MLKNEKLGFLTKYLPFLNRLDDSDIRAVTDSLTRAEYKAGETIISRDKQCSGLVIVESGRLRAYFESEDGKEITLYRLLPGNICILSASCVMKNINFEVTLEAEKNSGLAFIPAAVWGKLAEKNGAVKEFSMSLVNERFSEAMWVMEQMVSRNMGQRVASFLLEQSKLENSDTLSITHDEIARNLGTAREVISRVLKYLENENMLELSRHRITLKNISGLREAAG